MAGFSAKVSDPTSWLSHNPAVFVETGVKFNHFLPLEKLLQVFGGDRVKMSGLSEVFPSYLCFPWLMIGNLPGSPCFSWTPLPASPLVATYV